MYSSGGGDARSAATPNARDSVSSMPPEHPSAAVWDRQAFGRDKFDRADRDRYSSTKKDWSLDNRSSHRTSSALFSNGSLPGPPSKRRALGRHGPVVENGRYGSALGRISESSSSLRSPSENGKAERDVCSLSSGPSPGYSASPSTERPNKDLDGHHFRDAHLSPGDARPASSPRFDTSSRPYGNQNALEGLGPRDRERSKFSSSPYSWDTPHRDRDFRERAWSRPDYYRRTCPLPKLDSSREWSLGDRELLEGRIDRYGSASSRDLAFSDVLSVNNKEHPRHEWRSRDRSLYSGFSPRISACPPTSKDIGTASVRPEVLGAVSPPQFSPLHSSVSHDFHRDDTVLTSSKKRPRLTWGQGLAKYEKEKTEEDPSSAVKKPEEGSHHEGNLTDGSVALDCLERFSQNGNAFPCQDNCRPSEEQLLHSGGMQSDVQVELSESSCQESMACSSMEAFTREVLADKFTYDSRKADGGLESLLMAPSENVVPVTPALQPSILHHVQVFLESYERERPNVSKDVLTQHVEKVEFEIDLVEREIVKLDNEHGAHARLPKSDEVETLTDQTFGVPVSSDLNSPVGVFELPASPVSVVQPQLFMQCVASSAPTNFPSEGVLTVDKSVEGVPICQVVVVHGQESVNELGAMDQVMCETIEEGVSDIMGQNVVFSAQSVVCVAQPVDAGSHEVKGGTVCAESVQGRASLEECGDSMASLLFSNRETAEQSLSALSHLNAPDMETILQAGRLYDSPQEATVWKLNAESYERKRRFLESKVAEEKGNVRFAEGVLAAKYRAQRESWKQEQIGNYYKKDRDRVLRLWDPDQRNGWAPMTQQSSLRLCLVTGPTVLDANGEEILVARKLLSEPPIENEREYLRMPSMLLGKKERALHRFETKNALVVDPVAAEQERTAMNPWSAEEKKIFLDKYSLLGKNFSKIASFLEHKTVADCVQFYYRNQKTEEFQKVHRRHQPKKRRDSQTSALYLATTTSVSSRHREANAACMEGLTLVAVAAAAVSEPRDFSRGVRNAATNSCPISSTSSKAYRERHLNKQATTSSALAGKGSNGELIGGKGARNMHNRLLKGSHEEADSQWTDSERDLFINGVAMFGKNFHSISLYIGTKNQGQCKSFFSKARKRLGLDRLVEHHKAVLHGAIEQTENNAKQMDDMKAEPAINMKSGLSEQQRRIEGSPLHVDMYPAYLASEVQCEIPWENHDLEEVSVISALKSLQGAGHAEGVLPGTNDVCKPVPRAPDNPLKQEACSYIDSGDRVTGIPHNPQMIDILPLQGCTVDDSLACGETLQFKTESISVKMEPLFASNLTNGVSNATPSVVHAIAPKGLVSALLPNSLNVAPLVQSVQLKDKGLKVTEMKARREPTSWTQEEKEKFVDILKVHGKNWDRLRESLPAKSLTQIKTYFQNSKAKLGLGPEGTVNGNGRASSSWKRKADDSDSSSNAGSGGQAAPQKAPARSDDGSLKVSPSILVPSGGLGGNVLAAEALAYANLFGRNLLEDSINAQKVFHTMGLAPNSSTPGILPMFNSAIFPPPNLHPAQQSYIHPASMKTQQIVNHQQPQQSLAPLVVVQPHQLQQQLPMDRTHQDHPLPVVQHLHKQPAQLQLQSNQQALHQQQQQQQVVQQLQQQVAEAVLQQQLQPQLGQRQQQQQQQLQLTAQQVAHHHQQVLSHPQAQSNQQVLSQVVNQLSQASSQAMGLQLGTVSQSITASQQQQLQPGLFQSQPYQIHAKSQSLLQQHQQMPQLQQLQLLQLHRQQQQSQVQQAQAQQVQNQIPQLQQQSYTLLNEQQQQQLAILRGVMQLSSTSMEASKQCDSDFQTFAKSQQGAHEDLHQQLAVSQASQAPSKSQAIPEVQFRAGDVKLFGQSLLLQPASANQQLSGKVSSASSPQGDFSAASTSFILGKTSTDTLPKVPGDSFMQGQGWQQIVWPTAAFGNGGSSSTIASILKGSTACGELECHSVQEKVARMTERLIREARDMDDGWASDVSSFPHFARVQDARDFSSILTSLDHCALSDPASSLCGQSGEIIRPENDSRRSDQLVNLDHGITVNKSRGQEFSSHSAIAGGHVVASQGLPRVLDALVALAEWRLQNSSGGSGRLTDEFLSQSWEALQRDPGSLVEAGKASGSLAQMYAGGPEMLQQLRESLLYSPSHLMHLHPGAGGSVWATPSGLVHLNDAQRALAQSSSSFRVHNGVHNPARSDELGVIEARDIDGSGGAVG